MTKRVSRQSSSRREFLKTSGALVVFTSLPALNGSALAQSAGMPLPVPGELDSWVAIHPDGRISAFF